MKCKQILYIGLIICVIALLGTASIGGWIHSQQRQYLLNRGLIDALIKNDTKRALWMVNAGADPNTPLQPSPKPSIKGLWSYIMHRSAPLSLFSPTALQMACGAGWITNNHLGGIRVFEPDSSQLLDAMLLHGGNAKVYDSNNQTLLMFASGKNSGNHVIECLILHGVDVNNINNLGATALMYASLIPSHSARMRLLVAHGANVNMQNQEGETALFVVLHWAKMGYVKTPQDTVRELLVLGANPDIPTKSGDTSRKFCQRNHLTNIVSLINKKNK